MLHLKQKYNCGELVDEVQINVETVKNGIFKNQMTVRGLRDFLNHLIDEGYGSYGASFGYDSNCVFTYPSKCIKIKNNKIYFLEGKTR